MVRVPQSLLLLIALWLLPGLAHAQSTPACRADGTLTLGIFPRSNPAQVDTMFRPLAARLGKALGCRVELKTARDFAEFWKGVEAQAFDLVHYNQFHYIKSATDYEVVARNEEGGSGMMAGALFVRADSGISDIGQLRGKRIIFGGGLDAMMSHIVPRYLLLEAGLAPQDYTWEFAPNPPNAVMAVYFRQAEAAGGGDAVLGLPALAKGIKVSELKAIAKSAPVQQLPWSVRRSLPATAKKRIQAALLAQATDAAGRAALAAAGMSGIKSAKDADYDDCRTIVRKVQAVFPLE